MPVYSIWSEYVPYEVVCDDAVLAALASRRIVLLLAVTPPLAASVHRVVGACRDAGVTVGLWPMLDDGQGRWASAANVVEFCQYTRDLITGLAADGCVPDQVAVDLEPPIARLQRLMRGRLTLPPEGRQQAAAIHYGGLVDELTARGITTLAAVMPPVCVGPARARRGWQWFLETPIADIAYTRMTAMAYTSLFEGYSRALIRRADARDLLARLAAEAQRHHVGRAGISVGAVGTGALGDERVYRDVGELADDVAIVRACGIDDICLFNLDGALTRGPLQRWLDALVYTEAAAHLPPATTRAAAIWYALLTAGYGAGYVSRLHRPTV